MLDDVCHENIVTCKSQNHSIINNILHQLAKCVPKINLSPVACASCNFLPITCRLWFMEFLLDREMIV